MIGDLFQPTHLIVVLVIVLIVFGPGKLPELGAAFGKGIKEFKKGAAELSDDVSHASSAAPAPAAPAPAAPAAPAPSVPPAPVAAPAASAPVPAAQVAPPASSAPASSTASVAVAEPPAATAAPAAPVKCSKCGTLNQAGYRFCAGCGTQLTQAAA